MAVPGTTSQRPAVRLSDVLVLERRGAANRCQWLRGKLSAPSNENRQTAVEIVADTAVKWQCRGAVQHYDAWRSAVAQGARLGADARRRLVPFIRPVFGLPGAPPSVEHLQGHVGECVWFILARENVPAGLRLKAIEGPSFLVTTPGGDGLVVYQRGDDVLIFRLWEIKKHHSTGGVSRTVSRALRQLDEKAEEYLAQLTTVAGSYEPDLAQLFAALSDLWLDRDERSGAGVAVSTSDQYLPRSCFGRMHTRFPELSIGLLGGMVVALGDFPAFAASVRDRVWNAL
jgi:hypothetical protein